MSWSPIAIAQICAILTAAISVGASSAWAQEEDGPQARGIDEVIVILEPARAKGPKDLRGSQHVHADAELGLSRSAFATVVRVDDSAGEMRTISEVLARTVGVSSQSLGGLGAFSSISVRGADSGHTSVSVDGVPLSRIASVSADLGQFDLGSFESVELYRGGVPPEFGGAGVGGALQMNTALGLGTNGKAFQLSAGLGSYGARHLQARWLGGERDSERAYQLSAGYAGAEGDFAYFDDGGTPLNRADDQVSTRLNNGYDRFSLLARARLGKWTLGSRSSLQNQGLPGNAHNQAITANLATAHELVDAQYRDPYLWNASSALALRSYASVERQHFVDPQDEIGLLAQNAVYLTQSAGLGGNLKTKVSPSHQLIFDLETRSDWFRESPRGVAALPPSSGYRVGLTLAASEHAELRADRLYLDVGLRADLLRTNPTRDLFETDMQGPARFDALLSPRVSLRDRVAESLVLKTSAGRYLRTPTLLEMFGDRGFVLGNPGLQVEVGYTADAGFVWAPWRPLGAVDRVYVEAAAFASRPDNAIVFVNRNGLVAQAVNLEGARMLGSEIIASMRVQRRVTLTGNYGFIDARNRSGGAAYDKKLPGHPRHHVYLRADAAFEPQGHLVVLWADALRLSGNFVDELNVYELPPRFLLGMGVKLEIVEDLLAGLEIKNAGDLRQQELALDPAPSPTISSVPRAVSDVHGYPLPGRSIYLNLSWQY